MAMQKCVYLFLLFILVGCGVDLSSSLDESYRGVWKSRNEVMMRGSDTVTTATTISLQTNQVTLTRHCSATLNGRDAEPRKFEKDVTITFVLDESNCENCFTIEEDGSDSQLLFRDFDGQEVPCTANFLAGHYQVARHHNRLYLYRSELDSRGVYVSQDNFYR